jgi:Fe-S-cluster-containing dehydrogenase component
MKKWNLIVNVDDCTNCNLCVLAIHDEHVGNDFPGYAAEMPKHGHHWIKIWRKERGQAPMIDVAYVPVMCQHCDEAPCIAAAENDAVTKREDGIVVIDPVKAKDQKQLVEACPYGAIWWNEESQIPQAWIFDAHLLDQGWTEPRAAQVCATAALRAVKVEDAEMARIVEDEGLEVLKPDLKTKPRVWYKNLGRYTRCFIGGSLASERDGTVDCVEGARLTLHKGADQLAETISDAYGDFKFDGIEAGSGDYKVRVEVADAGVKDIEVSLSESVYLGEIRIG